MRAQIQKLLFNLRLFIYSESFVFSVARPSQKGRFIKDLFLPKSEKKCTQYSLKANINDNWLYSKKNKGRHVRKLFESIIVMFLVSNHELLDFVS